MEDYEYYHTDPAETDIIETLTIPTYSEVAEVFRKLAERKGRPQSDEVYMRNARIWCAVARHLRRRETKE